MAVALSGPDDDIAVFAGMMMKMVMMEVMMMMMMMVVNRHPETNCKLCLCFAQSDLEDNLTAAVSIITFFKAQHNIPIFLYLYDNLTSE